MDGWSQRRFGVNVLPERGEKARQVGRATGARKPRLTACLDVPGIGSLLAGFRPDGQRVDIEVGFGVEAQATEYAVVECLLHHVGIGCIEIEMQHAVRPEHQADGGAGLGIGGVIRQIIVKGEALTGALRTDAAGDVDPSTHHVFPQALAGGDQELVAGLGSHVGHAGKQIHRPHGVSFHRRLLSYWQVGLVLVVGRIGPEGKRCGVLASPSGLDVKVMRLAASFVDKIGRQFEVAPRSGAAVQFHEGKLDLLVARVAACLSIAGAEAAVNVIRKPADRVEKAASPRSRMVRHSGLDPVAGTVQLMGVTQVGPACRRVFHGEVAVHVAVVPLRLEKEVNDLVGQTLEFWVALRT